MSLLHVSIKDKVEIKDPRTYDEVTQMAREQWRKKMRKQELARKEREGSMYATCGHVVEPLPMDMHVEREHHVEAPRVVDMNHGQDSLHQDIQRLTEQIGNLNLAMQGIQNQVRRPQGERPIRNRGEHLQCYNCAERGHIAPQCPYPRREPGGMYPIMQRPQDNANNANINGVQPQAQAQAQGPQQAQGQQAPHVAVGVLEAIPISEEEDDVDVFVGKRTRAQKSDHEDSPKESRAKGRRKMDNGKAPMEEGESSKQVKARRRRKIGMDDFQLGEGQWVKVNLLIIF